MFASATLACTPVKAQFFSTPEMPQEMETTSPPLAAAPAPAPKPKPIPKPKPKIIPLPPARPWGVRDAFTPDPALTAPTTQSAEAETPPPASAAPPVVAAPVIAAPAPDAIAEALTQVPDPQAPALDQQASREPPPVEQAAPAAPDVVAANAAPPTTGEPQLRDGEGAGPGAAKVENQQLASLGGAASALDPTPVDTVFRHRDPGALLLIVRPGLNSATDLSGRRIAAGAHEDQVWAALRSIVSGPFTEVKIDGGARIERLVQGDVDAVVVGLGPAIPDADVVSAAVGSFKAVQLRLAKKKPTATTQTP